MRSDRTTRPVVTSDHTSWMATLAEILTVTAAVAFAYIHAL
jgi:hypothetical protein